MTTLEQGIDQRFVDSSLETSTNHEDIRSFLLLLIFIIMMMPSLPGITLKQSVSRTYRGRTVSIQLDDESESSAASVVKEDCRLTEGEVEPLSPSPLPQPPPPSTTGSRSNNPWNHIQSMTMDNVVSFSSTPPTTSTANTGTPSSPQGKPRRLRAVVEHIVYHPLVTWFTCGGAGGTSTASRSTFLHPTTTSMFQTKAPVAILQTMKQFPYQGRLQKLGCSTLRDLALDSWPLKVSVVEAGAIPVVIKAMRVHGSDAALQLMACRVLYELVNVPPLMEDDRSIIIALMQTMEHHGNDEDVLVVALDVLMAMTDSQAEHQGQAKESRGGALESLRHQLGGVVLAKLEHGFRGRNEVIYIKAGILLKRLYY